MLDQKIMELVLNFEPGAHGKDFRKRLAKHLYENLRSLEEKKWREEFLVEKRKIEGGK